MCFGPFKRLCHWGPLTAVGIIKVVTGSTIHCSGMWWPPTTLSGLLNTVCFMSLSALTLYNLMSAMFHGPGYLPFNWMPADPIDCQYLQNCGVCQGYKAPRSHHCRKCRNSKSDPIGDAILNVIKNVPAMPTSSKQVNPVCVRISEMLENLTGEQKVRAEIELMSKACELVYSARH